MLAHPIHQHIGLVYRKALGDAYLWNRYIIQAIGGAAGFAEKMHMVVVVVALAAGFFAQGIHNGIVGRGYGMDDAFIYKSLQGAVNGNPVKIFAAQPFNISMRKCFRIARKHFQYLQPVIGNAKLVVFQYVNNCFFHLY